MSDTSTKSDQAIARIEEVVEKFEQLDQPSKTLVTMNIISKLDDSQRGEVFNFLQPLVGCNIILLLHQSGHVKIVKGILDYMEARSILNLEKTCWSLFSIIRLHLCWKSLIEQKMNSESIWRGIVERRGWMKFFDLSDVRKVKNPDFYRNLYPVILAEIDNLEKRWQRGRYTAERIQFNNSNGVYCLQYDRERVVSGHRDKTVKFWDLKTNSLGKVLSGHTGSVLCLQFDHEKVITGSSDCTIRIWDLITGEEVRRIETHTHPVLYLRFDDEILVSCSKDNLAIVFNNHGGPDFDVREVKKLVAHRAAVNVVDFDSTHIVTASGDRTIQVWCRETLTSVNTLVGHKRGIACLHQRGNTVVSGSSDKTIRVWDIVDGVCLRVLFGHEDLVRCIRFNSRYIVSGSYDGKIKIWDIRSLLRPGWNSRDHCLATLQEHSGRVFRLMFDDFQIMTCSHDDTIVTWNFFNSNSKPILETPFD